MPATLYAWAQDHRGRRIAIEPFDFAESVRIDHCAAENGKRMLLFTYPLYGPDGANEVETIATIRDHRAVLPASCHDVVAGARPTTHHRRGRLVAAGCAGDRDAGRSVDHPGAVDEARPPIGDGGGTPGSLALLSVDPTQPPPC